MEQPNGAAINHLRCKDRNRGLLLVFVGLAIITFAIGISRLVDVAHRVWVVWICGFTYGQYLIVTGCVKVVINCSNPPPPSDGQIVLWV